MFKITMTQPKGPDGLPAPPDRLARQMAEHAARTDPSDTYTSREIVTELPPDNTRVAVKLKLQVGSPFAFAVYGGDNPAFIDQPQEVWENAAKRALIKWAAIEGRTIFDGPKQEQGRPLNFFVDARSPATARPEG